MSDPSAYDWYTGGFLRGEQPPVQGQAPEGSGPSAYDLFNQGDYAYGQEPTGEMGPPSFMQGGGEEEDPSGMPSYGQGEAGMDPTAPRPGMKYGGLGGTAMPLPKAIAGSDRLTLLWAKDLARNGAVEIQELNKAAKFRRALSMIQETFAEITGRPDIAQRVRQRMVDEDQGRAAQLEGQILARVGRAAMQEETEEKEAKQAALADKTESDKVKLMASHKAGAIDDATKSLPYLIDDEGNKPDLDTAADAFYKKRMGVQTDFFQRYRLDPSQAKLNDKKAEEAALSEPRIKQAGAESAARARASEGVRNSEAGMDADAKRAAKIDQAQADVRTDPKNVTAEAARAAEIKKATQGVPRPAKYNPRPVNQAMQDVDAKGATPQAQASAIQAATNALRSAAASGVPKADLEAEADRVLRRKTALKEKLEAQIKAAENEMREPDYEKNEDNAAMDRWRKAKATLALLK